MHYSAKFQLLIQLVKGLKKYLSPICSPLLFGASPRSIKNNTLNTQILFTNTLKNDQG